MRRWCVVLLISWMLATLAGCTKGVRTYNTKDSSVIFLGKKHKQIRTIEGNAQSLVK